MSDKQSIINKIYYDRGGFGSKKITLDDSRKIDKSIKMSDIDEFFKNNIRQKKQLKGYNSFVAPEANCEYQIDLMFLVIWTLQNLKLVWHVLIFLLNMQ